MYSQYEAMYSITWIILQTMGHFDANNDMPTLSVLQMITVLPFTNMV